MLPVGSFQAIFNDQFPGGAHLGLGRSWSK